MIVAVCICVFECYLVHFGFIWAPVTTHFDIPRFIHAYLQYLFILFSYNCSDVSLLVIVARSYAYATKLIMDLDVPKVYPWFLFCNHLNSGSQNMIKMHGLNVFPCIVPLCIGIYFVWLKSSPMNMVLECEYMLPTNLTTYSGYPKSSIITSRRAWSIDPNAYLKSM